MKTTNLLSASAALVLLATTACQTPTIVHTKLRPAADFSACRSFVVLPLPEAVTSNDLRPTWLLPAEARLAAADALATRGLVESSPEHADICVLVRGNAMPQMEVTEWSFGVRGGGSVVNAPEPHRHYRPRLVGVREPWRTTSRYYERTLIVEIFENKTKEPLWAGWSTSRSSRSRNTHQVEETVRRILAQLSATESNGKEPKGSLPVAPKKYYHEP